MRQEFIYAPIPGVYYDKPSPTEDTFLKPGQKFSEGDTLFLIEVMKSFNEIKAEGNGEVVNILVNNEDIVEAGQEIIEVLFDD